LPNTLKKARVIDTNAIPLLNLSFFVIHTPSTRLLTNLIPLAAISKTSLKFPLFSVILTFSASAIKFNSLTIRLYSSLKFNFDAVSVFSLTTSASTSSKPFKFTA
jgi:hypothetical protein